MAVRGPARTLRSFGEAPWVAVLVAVGLIAPIAASASSLMAASGASCAEANGGPPPDRSPIQHVFFLIKENHAFENYFGALPGAIGYPPNGTFAAAFNSDARIHPFPLDSNSTPDLPHDHASELADLDGGRNDGFVAEAAAHGAAAPADAVGYYTAAQIPDYYAYAHSYTLADEFFTGVLGPTVPNRLFDLGLTSVNWTTDQVPPPSAVEGPTLLNQLADAGVPWQYFYSGDPQYIAPMLVPAIADDRCMLARVVPMDRFLPSLDGPEPPSVAFIDPSPDPLYSEHPAGNVSLGEEWTAAVVNAIFQSPIGASSVVFLFFDEAGGFWDPVAPPTAAPLGDGFRVPLLVLSPYTPAGRIVHQVLDPASLLKFAEAAVHLPYLTPRIAEAPELSGFFDMKAPPRAPLILPSPVSLPSSPTADGGGAWAPRDAGRGVPIVVAIPTAIEGPTTTVSLGPRPPAASRFGPTILPPLGPRSRATCRWHRVGRTS